MTSFLLLISFMIHIITLIVLFQLYQSYKNSEQAQSKQLQSLFETYLEEIKQENEKLQSFVRTPKKISETKIDEKIKTGDTAVSLRSNDDAYEVETSLEAQILALAERGFDVDQIAKKLQCGKTEAELILKFHKNN